MEYFFVIFNTRFGCQGVERGAEFATISAYLKLRTGAVCEKRI